MRVKTMSEKTLKCGNWQCDEEVDECDQCGSEFKVGQKIICLENGEHHFCSEGCMEAFLDDNIIEAETYLDDED